MQKTIIAAALAGLIAMPALAQTRVTLSGRINAAYEWHRATGATSQAGNIKTRDRMTESGSEFHIRAFEDLGNGNQAFVDIQTAVDVFNRNSPADTPDAGRLASRRAAIGLQGSWGMLQLGKWDLHYHAQIWGNTGPNAGLNQMYGAVSLLNQVGGRSFATMGCRCDNTIRYVTPNISGFQLGIGYTRGTGETAWNPHDQNRVDRAVSLHVNYRHGGLNLMAAYWNRENAIAGHGLVGTGHPTAVATGLNAENSALRNEESIRVGAAYTFDMGLTIGLTWDYTQTRHKFVSDRADLKLRRHAWVVPIYYRTGPHQINFAYGRANDIKDFADTGTQYWTLNYGYALSRRTTAYIGIAQYRNERFATYDFWSNTAIGLTTANQGADPTSFAIGLIHAF